MMRPNGAEERLELEETQISAAKADPRRFATLYGFDADQKKKAEEILARRKKDTDEWYLLADNRDRINKYLNELAKADAAEQLRGHPVARVGAPVDLGGPRQRAVFALSALRQLTRVLLSAVNCPDVCHRVHSKCRKSALSWLARRLH